MLHFKELLNNDTLAFIKLKVNDLNHLNSILKKYLNSDLSQHCRVANFEKDILYLEVDNAVWATRLRFCSLQLKQVLQKESLLSTLKQIRFYIKQES